MELHERIKAWREYAGLTQKEVAQRLGLSWQAVLYWERGDTAPKHEHLEAFAGLVGLSMAGFYGPVPAKPKRRAS